MRTRVAALGGSLLRPEVEDRQAWLRKLAASVKATIVENFYTPEPNENNTHLILVVGGGAPAREGIELAAPLIGSDVASLDRIGIAATRLNASIVAETIRSAEIEIKETSIVPNYIPESVDDAVKLAKEFPVTVMGGTVPGHTTDTVAIQIAKKLGSEMCIIATNVAHVYSSDPKTNNDAKKFHSMTHNELLEIVGPATHQKAGKSGVIDPIGADIARNSGINLAVLDGRDTERLTAALNGESFEGTNIEG